jgi:hypothetical protein
MAGYIAPILEVCGILPERNIGRTRIQLHRKCAVLCTAHVCARSRKRQIAPLAASGTHAPCGYGHAAGPAATPNKEVFTLTFIASQAKERFMDDREFLNNLIFIPKDGHTQITPSRNSVAFVCYR